MITSILSIILITPGIGVAHAAYFGGSNTFGATNTVAIGSNSAAFGGGTTASGNDSVAFGNGNTASGNESAAFGVGSKASGIHTASFGHYTTAQSFNSFAIGRCNEISGSTWDWIGTDPLFVIGNGDYSPDSCITTNNAVTILKNGNVGIGISSPTQLLQVNGIIESTSNGFKFPDGTTQTTANAYVGDITSVTAGTGLSDGGSTGDVTLTVDTTTIQNRVTGTCTAGESIRIINSDGTVTCEVDTDTQLDQTGVESLGFVTGAHTVDTDTQLDQTGVESLGFVTGAHTTDTNYWTQTGNDILYTTGNIGIGTSTLNTDALVWDNGRGALRHHYDALTWDRQVFNFLLDADNNQISSKFQIFNDVSSSFGNTPVVSFSLDGKDSWINSGDVGIGTTTPNSKLEVTGGYFELATSSGTPPSDDCDNTDEYGRMKVDSTTNSTNLYVCTPSGWATK